MGLKWVRYDTNMPWNPKVLGLVEAGKWRAIAVYDHSLAYSGAFSTDGFVPKVALSTIHGRPRDAADLVTAELWAKDPAGWFIPDYADFNPSTKDSADIRAEKQVASRKGNCVRWHGIDCGCWRDAA